MPQRKIGVLYALWRVPQNGRVSEQLNRLGSLRLLGAFCIPLGLSGEDSRLGAPYGAARHGLPVARQEDQVNDRAGVTQ